MLEFHNGRISRIVSLDDNTERQEFSLGPALIANFSSHREKRRLVRYSDLPPALVDAVLSAEDKHFFHHSGIDLVRALKAAYVDLKEGRKEQGASTLTMQLARSLWLDPQKSWQRKFEEVLITMHLEFKLSKQQIFEDYANEVYLGRQRHFQHRRLRRGGARLLRQRRFAAHHSRSRAAGGDGAAPVLFQSVPLSASARASGATWCSVDARQRLSDEGRI